MLKRRILPLLVLLLMATTGAWAQNWTNIVVNGDLEGSDLQCFFVKEYDKGSENVTFATVASGVGKNGSKAIVVTSTGEEVNGWDTQFFLRLPYELPAGTKYVLSFDYMATYVANCEIQMQNEPNEYIDYRLDGTNTFYPDFPTIWQTYSTGEVTVPDMCDGSQNADGYKNNFQTISFSLGKYGNPEQPIQYFIDNIKVEIKSIPQAGLTSQPYMEALIAKAQALTDADNAAVAVGKLQTAITTAQAITTPTFNDILALQAAIDQFQHDNAVEFADKVRRGFADWNGTGVYKNATVNIVTGAETHLAENYHYTSVGNKLYQTVTGLDNGTYDIELYATSHNAWGATYMNGYITDTNPIPTLDQDATDVAYVYGTSGSSTVQTWITARHNGNYVAGEPEVYKVQGVKVENGELTMGLALAKEGMTEWHTIQIKSLKRVDIVPKEAYATLKTAMQTKITEATALKTDARTEGLDAFNAAIQTAQTNLNGNLLNIAELNAAIEALQTAMDTFLALNGKYTVTLDDGNKDTQNWTITPAEATTTGVAAGQTVTLKYDGRLKVKSITATTDAEPPAPVEGKYTINNTGRQVNFAKGNVQATTIDGNTWTWAFAEHQWDYIGGNAANTTIINPGVVNGAGTVDLFGWLGTSSNNAGATMYGISNSKNQDDYGTETNDLLYDWGWLIGDGTIWRTLTQNEWYYLLFYRHNTTIGGKEARFAKGTVNNVPGLILFPDEYEHPAGVTTPTGINALTNDFTVNNYDVAAWTQMENVGCIFLPAAGCRNGTEYTNTDRYVAGKYWSSTPHSSQAYNAYFLNFTNGTGTTSVIVQAGARYYGYSVRLVKDAE